MSGVLQYQYSFLILHLTFKTVRKTNASLTPEVQICKRPGDVESSEVEKLAQSKEQHELIHIDSNDEGKFAISNTSYFMSTFYSST